MNKEFVPYDIALAIYQLDKEVDFGEDFGYWHQYNNKWFIETPHSYDYGTHKNTIPAPLYQQAFRWFREEHDVFASVGYMDDLKSEWGASIKGLYETWGKYDLGFTGWFKTYEEAELACLRKLIEIVKQNKDE